MQQFFDVIQSTTGVAIPNAQITVYNSLGVLATLYSDNGVTTKSNPVSTSADGEYFFYAANGIYHTTISSSGYVAESRTGILLFDPTDNLASNQVAYTPAGTGAVVTTVQNKLRESVSVKDFGAVGDGVTDDTAAIQAGLTRCALSGDALYFPPGKYLVTGLAANNVALIGTGVMDNGIPYANSGSVLCQTDTTKPLITIGGGVTFNGMSFYYPNQINGGISPVVYLPTIFASQTASVTNLNITNCLFINSYDCINMTQGTQSHGRVMLSNVQAYGINKFMYLSGVADVVTCIDCQITVGNFQDIATPGSVLRGYTQSSGIGFDLAGRVDGLTINSCIIYGYKSSIRLLSGTPDFLKIVNCNLDSTINGVEIGGTAQITNSLISGNAFSCMNPYDAASPTYGIKVASTADISDFIISNNNFIFCGRDCVNIQPGSTDRVLIDGNKFSYYGKATGLSVDAYGVYANDSSDFIICNNEFITNYTNGVAIGINGSTNSIVGNIIDSNKYAINILGGVNYNIANNSAKNTITKCLKITTNPNKIIQSANLWDATSDLVVGVIDTYNYGTISANTVISHNVTVPGADANDIVQLGFGTTPIFSELVYSAYTSTFGTVTIVVSNTSASPVVIGTQTIKLLLAPRF
jgi:hypothetical protein